MKYNMLTKQITLYIIIAVVGFIAVIQCTDCSQSLRCVHA